MCQERSWKRRDVVTHKTRDFLHDVFLFFFLALNGHSMLGWMFVYRRGLGDQTHKGSCWIYTSI